ncbi:MAG: translocation/assembly module TamB domain-containing protein [Desulfobacterales bacterium]
MLKPLKIALITISFLASLFFLCLLGIFFYVHTDHAGRQIMAQINNRIPGQIIFKDYDPALNKGKIELGNILVKDPEGHIVAGTDKLLVQISWSQLFSGNIVVEEIFIKNPEIKLIVDAEGNLSLSRAFVSPKTEEEIEPQKKTKKRPPFNLVIENFLLETGTIQFENPSKGVHADLKGIRLSGSGNFEKNLWQVDLSTDKGSWKNPKGRAEIDSLSLSGTLKEEAVSEIDFRITTPSSNISIVGSAQDIFSDPRLNLNMDFGIHLPEVHEAFFPQSPYTGKVTGNLSAKGVVSNPHVFFDMTYSGGKIADLNIQKINLQAVLQDRLIDLSPLEIEFISGNIAANATSDLRDVFPDGFVSQPESFEQLSYNLDIDVNRVDLKELLGDNFEGKGRIEGIISAEGRGISSEEARADIKIDLAGSEVTMEAITPVDVLVKATAYLKQGQAVIEHLSVSAGPTEILADGHFHMISKDIMANMRASSQDIGATLNPLGIKGPKGAFNFEATASGTLEKPFVELLLEGNDIRMENIALGDVDIRAKLFEGSLAIQKAELKNRNSSLEISGELGIFAKNDLKFHDDPSVNLNIKAAPVYLEDFLDQVRAKISMNAQIQGTLQNPQGDYELRAEKIATDAQKLEVFMAKGKLADHKIHFEPFQVFFSPNHYIDGSGWISTDKNFSLQLVSEGIFLNQIDKIREQNIAEGLLVLDISGQGNLANPRIGGTVSVEELQVNQKDLGTFKINVELADYLAKLNGRFNFDFSAGYHLKKQDFNVDVHFDDTDLSPYFNLAGLNDFSGLISGNIKASGNAEKIEQTIASGQILLLKLFVKKQELIKAENFQATFENQRLLIPGLQLRLLDGGNLNIEANAVIDGPLHINADGNIPLQGLKMVTQSLSDITGDLKISARVEGTVQKPDIRGEIVLEQVGFTIPELFQKIHGVNGRIVITPKSVDIEKLRGNLDRGRFELSGNMAIDDFSLQQIKMDLAARSLPIRIPDTLDVLLQSDLRLSGTPDKALLAGELIILEGVYFKDVNVSLVQGITQRTRSVEPSKPETTVSMLKNLNLDISVKRRNPFWVDNNLARLDINPDIRITGTAHEPIIEGRTTIESGTIRYQRKTFTVEKGIIDFVNPYELDPIVDIESSVKIRKWLITMTISGTPDNLTLSLKSDPPEEDGDILSLLVLGRTTRELIRSEGGSSRSSEQMVAELVADTFGEQIKEITGLDYLDVETENDEQFDDESEGVKVTVGKKLSERLTVKYSVDSRTGEMIQRAISEYKLLENIIISSFQNTSGVFGGELQYRLEFR